MHDDWGDYPDTDGELFTRRNRMRMVFWSAFLLVAWSLLFLGLGLAQAAIHDLQTTPLDPAGYEAVRYRRGEPEVREARPADMRGKKYRGVTTLAIYGTLSLVALFLLVTASVDYRTRLLGWSIRQLPRV